MAAKTVHAHGRELVAPNAELPLGVYRNRRSVRGIAHMAFDAPGQAVLGGANAVVNRLVTLVFDHLHVVAAHEVRGLHAAVELRSLRPFSHVGSLIGGPNGQGAEHPDQTDADQAASYNGVGHRHLPNRYSPSPILM